MSLRQPQDLFLGARDDHASRGGRGSGGGFCRELIPRLALRDGIVLVNYSTETLMALLQRSEFEVNQFTHQSIRDNPTALANSIAPGLYPPARVAKGVRVSVWQAWVRDLMYLALSTACIPPTFLEAACGLGSALMVKARVKT